MLHLPVEHWTKCSNTRKGTGSSLLRRYALLLEFRHTELNFGLVSHTFICHSQALEFGLIDGLLETEY